MSIGSRPVSPSDVGLSPENLEWEDAHADQVRPVDTLEALGDHGADAQQRRAFRSPVTCEPEPYSLPAITTRGTASDW